VEVNDQKHENDENDDWFPSCMDAVTQAAASAQDALSEQVASFARARQERLDGVVLCEIVDGFTALGGIRVRRDADRAIREYQHAVMVFRANLIKALVDEENMTLTAVAEQMEITRQTATRLYYSVREFDEQG
jgi:hypothetical protein